MIVYINGKRGSNCSVKNEVEKKTKINNSTIKILYKRIWNSYKNEFQELIDTNYNLKIKHNSIIINMRHREKSNTIVIVYVYCIFID